MARPLAGYSVNGVTLTAPASVPGSAVDAPLAVTTTAVAGSRAPKNATRSPEVEPDPGDAAAGAALRADAVGGEVQQLGVGGDEAQRLVAGRQLDGADDLVAVLERDDVPLVAVEHLGVDPLDDAVAGAEREARARRWPATSRASARSPASSWSISLSGSPPWRLGSLAESGQLGHVEHAEPEQPARAR